MVTFVKLSKLRMENEKRNETFKERRWTLNCMIDQCMVGALGVNYLKSGEEFESCIKKGKVVL